MLAVPRGDRTVDQSVSRTVGTKDAQMVDLSAACSAEKLEYPEAVRLAVLMVG